MWRERIFGFLDYYKYMYRKLGLKWMTSLSDTKYPKMLALGYWGYTGREIVVCKILNWKLRLWHERGHAVGFSHTMEKGHVMHPWGIFRGEKGVDEIKKRMENRNINTEIPDATTPSQNYNT